MDKKSCENCKHFMQHFVISHTVFMPINCGHCMKRRIAPKERRSFPFIGGCEQWEYNEAKKAERQEDIEKAIKHIEQHLNEMVQIIKFDKGL